MGYKQKGTLVLEFSFSLLVCMKGKGAQYVEAGWDVSREPGNRVPKKSFGYNWHNMRNIKMLSKDIPHVPTTQTSHPTLCRRNTKNKNWKSYSEGLSIQYKNCAE